MNVRERLGGGIRQPVDDLRAELLDLPAGDDRHLDALGERDQQLADPRIDRALGRREGVVEVERDEAGGMRSAGDSVTVLLSAVVRRERLRHASATCGASLLSG